MTHLLRSRRLPRVSASVLGLLLLTSFLDPAAVLPRLSAQESDPVLTGSVRLEGQPVSDVRVSLHRVDSRSSGEVATAITDASGAFRFPLVQAQDVTFTVFFATADYLGVRFLGPPLHPTAATGEYTIAVHDTASVLPEPVRIVRRDIVLLPEVSGAWEFNEVIRILNPTRFALTSTTGLPTWEFQIPLHATDFETGECALDGETASVLPHEVSRMDDRVLLLAPVIPGARDLCIRYRLPASPGRTQLALESSTDTLNLFVRQPSHLSGVSGLTTTRMIDADGVQFLQYAGTDLLPGARIDLQWTRVGGVVNPLLAALLVTLLLLGAGFWAALRNRPPPRA